MYIPEMYISVYDYISPYYNVTKVRDYQEVLRLAFEAIYLSQHPICEDSVLRPDECP